MINSFTLSPEAVDILGEDRNVKLRQFPFEIPYSGATWDERAQIRGKVWAELERRKLVEKGREEPEVEQALKLLHGSDIAVAVTALEARSEDVFRARVAATGRAGVLAVQNERGVTIEFVDPRGLARICTNLLPDEPTGHLESATLSTVSEQKPARKTDNAQRDSWLGSAQATPRSRGGAEMRKAQQILALPVKRVGYFFVTGRDDRGTAVRLPAIGWRDTEEGRYSVTTRRNNNGEQWNTFAGADKPRMAQYLNEQFKQFQDR
jgi:hypothetical protein